MVSGWGTYYSEVSMGLGDLVEVLHIAFSCSLLGLGGSNWASKYLERKERKENAFH